MYKNLGSGENSSLIILDRRIMKLLYYFEIFLKMEINRDNVAKVFGPTKVNYGKKIAGSQLFS